MRMAVVEVAPLPQVPSPHPPAPHPLTVVWMASPVLIWYAPTTPEPLPVSDALAVAVAVNVYVLLLVTVIWYSWFKTAAVIFPPRDTALLKVTKSPVIAP